MSDLETGKKGFFKKIFGSGEIEESVEDLKEEIEAQGESLIRARKELDELNTLWQKDKKRLEAALAEAARIKAQSEDLEAAREEIDRLRAQVARAESADGAQREKLQKAYETEKRAAAAARSQLADAAREMRRQEQLVAQKSEAARKANETATGLRRSEQALRQELEDLKKKFADLQSGESIAAGRLAELEADAAASRKALEEAGRKNTSLQSDLLSAQDEGESLRTEVASLRDKLEQAGDSDTLKAQLAVANEIIRYSFGGTATFLAAVYGGAAALAWSRWVRCADDAAGAGRVALENLLPAVASISEVTLDINNDGDRPSVTVRGRHDGLETPSWLPALVAAVASRNTACALTARSASNENGAWALDIEAAGRAA